MKVCIHCHLSKPLDDFGNYKRYPDGKHRICRVCWNIDRNAYRWEHGAKRSLPLFERMWESVAVCSHGIDCPFCCWPWLKSCDKDGYGKIALTNAYGQQIHAHVTRILYEIWHAFPLDPALLVCHYCDHPMCCSPSHFWLGSLNDNRQDCVRKGRTAKGLQTGVYTMPEAFPRGEKHPQARLSHANVLTIRAAHKEGASASSLGRSFHVSKQSILAIIHRRTYKHI